MIRFLNRLGTLDMKITKGYLTQDPTILTSANGIKHIRLLISTRNSHPYAISIWGERFKDTISHLKQGDFIRIKGELYTESFIDVEGKKQLHKTIQNVIKLALIPVKK